MLLMKRRTRVPPVLHLNVVQFAQKTKPLVIPKPGLPARNLLAADVEAADSSRDKAALRNDNSLGIFKLHHLKSVEC
jgi:hypothetical protein